jgi:hypothetical protein
MMNFNGPGDEIGLLRASPKEELDNPQISKNKN